MTVVIRRIPTFVFSPRPVRPRPVQPLVGSRCCATCQEVKPRSEFHRVTPTAVRTHCKPCWRAIQRERFRRDYAADPAAAIAQVKRWLDTGDNRARIQVAWRASAKLNAAIKKGLIVRPASCSECGKACKPDGAHYDYARPFDVRWLCRSCHVLWDQAEPKTRKPTAEGGSGLMTPSLRAVLIVALVALLWLLNVAVAFADFAWDLGVGRT